MHGTLIESQRHLSPRTGGSVVSIIAHAALIVGAVISTTHSGLTAVLLEKTPLVHVTLAQPAAPEPQPVTQRSHDPSPAVALRVPDLPTIRTPVIIPPEIPPIDLTSGGTPAPSDFGDGRDHHPPCGVTCPAANGSGDPNLATWAPNELQMRFRDQPVPPRYPERLRAAGIEGSVLVKFIVDTTGRIDLPSVEVVNSTHELFTVAVRDALARMRFNPSTVDGRKIRAAAMMPFQFTLSSGKHR